MLTGGKDPGAAFRKYVKAGLVNPTDASVDRLKDWVYGSEDLLRRIAQSAANDDPKKLEQQIRGSSAITVDDAIESSAMEYRVSPAEYCGFRSGAGGRGVAAYLRRRLTSTTLAELSERFGLGHPDSSSEMVKRARKLIESNREARKRAERIKERLLRTPKPEPDPTRSVPTDT